MPSDAPNSPRLTADPVREPHGSRGLLVDTTVRICPNPVFMIGSPRSGTSILPWSLSRHSDFWTMAETEFLHVLFGRAHEVYETMSESHTFIREHGVDRREFFSSLGLGINALISGHSEGKRWIDQTPGYTTMAWLLADMFPGACFIHVLRDGRAVVNSMLHFGNRPDAKAGAQGLQRWATDFDAAVETWRHYVEFALNFCAHNPDRTLTVKNEDLVGHTDKEFEKIFTFLGAIPDREAADFFRNSRVNSSFGPQVWRTQQQAEPVRRATAADAWRQWSPGQRARFTDVAGELLRRLDYPGDVG